MFWTFVSQGTATASPGAVMLFQKKQVKEEGLALEEGFYN
jgi:hypothetical protein